MQGDLIMVANAGTVKGKLILDTTDFTAKWKKILNDVNTSVRPKGLDSIKKQLSDVKDDAKQMASSTNSSIRKMENDFQSYFSKVKSTAKGASSSVKNSLNTINNTRFDKLSTNLDSSLRKMENDFQSYFSKVKSMNREVNSTRFDKLSSNLDSVVRRMQNTASSGVRAIGNKVSIGLNSVKFDNLSTRFSATIQKMQSTASAGVKSISNSFNSMESGINDIFATVAGGAGAYELFQYGMGRATTKQMLANKGNGADIYSQYQKYTVASSTADSDINRIMKYVMNSAPPGQTYRALNAIDSAAYNSDPIQRQELLRNYGNYLSNGYSESLFRGDVTAGQAEILKNAKTPAERIAAMEQIAQQQNTMGLSTTKTGPMGNYNKLLAASDTLMRGMADGLEKLLNTAAPLLDWFNGLDSGTQTFIGNLITFGAAITAVSGGVRILGSLLKPLGPAFSLVKKGIGKLGDITGVTSKLSGLKTSIKTKIGDAFSGAGDTVGSKLKDVKSKITKGLDGASDTVSKQMSNVKTAVTDKLGGLKQWIQDKWNPNVPGGKGSTSTSSTPFLGTTAGLVLSVAALSVASAVFEKVVAEPTSNYLQGHGLPSGIANPLTGGYTPVGQVFRYGGLTGIAQSIGSFISSGNPLKALEPLGATIPSGGLPIGPLSGVQSVMAGISALPSAFKILPSSLSGLEKLTGSSNLGGMLKNLSPSSLLQKGLSSLLPGSASATGKGGKQSISQDIFGKNGLLDFNRGGSGFKIPSFKWPSLGGLPGQIINGAKQKIGSFKWPNLGGLPGQIIGWTKGKIGSFKWPNLGGLPGQVISWAKGKVGSFHWPSLGGLPGQVIGWAKSKIGSFHWSIPSWQSILGVIKSFITPFHWPSGPGGVIGGIIHTGKSAISAAKAKAAAAKNVATSVGSKVVSAASHPVSTIKSGASWLWNKLTGRGPRGPYDNIKNILDDTYSGLSYMDYPGTRGATLNQILNSGGNCMDLTMAGMTQLAGIGIPSEMVWGSWNGNSHVWLRAPGLGDYDPARQILNHTSTPPARGPGSDSKTIIIEKGAFTITGPVYGIDDLDTKMEEKFIKLANKYLA